MPEKQSITEKEGVHTAWYEVSPKTPEELATFATKLMTEYAHDYGTICHAAAALAVASCKMVSNDPTQGGLTGFQAGAIAHEFVRGWLQIKGPMSRVEWEYLLFPQYEKDFNTIPRGVWEWAQEAAKEKLAGLELPDAQEAHPDVIAHWKLVAKGIVPFGLKVRKSQMPEEEQNELLRRAQKLLDEHGPDWTMPQELLAFIRRPELRKVAEGVINDLRQSFASVTVLRKLLEADEALGRAIWLHHVVEGREEFGPSEEEKKNNPEVAKEDEVWKALEESVKLQSHYAHLLNMHDGGLRNTFENSEEWIARLRETPTPGTRKSPEEKT